MTGDLKKDTDPRFQHLLGKRVKVVHKGKTWIGILEFAGINTNFESKPFQVTIGRTPLFPVDPNSLVEEPYNPLTVTKNS